MLNAERVQIIADALDELNEYVVYVGGAVVEMYVDDPSMTDIRPTMDIDCVTQLESRRSFWDFEEKLRKISVRRWSALYLMMKQIAHHLYWT